MTHLPRLLLGLGRGQHRMSVAGLSNACKTSAGGKYIAG